MRHTFILFLAVLLAACTIQKRNYRPGFHVEWKKTYARLENEAATFPVVPVESADGSLNRLQPGENLQPSPAESSFVPAQPINGPSSSSASAVPVGERCSPLNDDTLYVDEQDIVEIRKVTEEDWKHYRGSWAFASIMLIVGILLLGGVAVLAFFLTGMQSAVVLLLLCCFGLFLLVQLLFASNNPDRVFDRKVKRAGKKGKQVVVVDREEWHYRKEKEKEQARERKTHSPGSGTEVLVVVGVLIAAIFGAVLLF